MSSGSPAGGATIVGMGCRFPGGADTPDAFWRLVREGVDAIRPIPPGRFDPDSVPIASHEGGFLDDVDLFDAAFFGVSPREARRMDPQHRLLLEVVHEAIEDAGIAPAALRGRKVGVWVGLWMSDYEQAILRDISAVDFHGLTGTGRYSASGRISFLYDFRGPAVTVDTACSAALVALEAATRAVEDGTVEMAVVAAANLVLQPFVNVAYSKSGMLSRGARCRFGAENPDGYVRSEGAAALLLGPRSMESELRRTPRARVRAVAVNADGFVNGQLATPSRESQEVLVRTAWDRSGLDRSAVPYVEAHGTGTKAGDPVELGALGSVLGPGRPADQPLLVGSVKTNIGHTEACSGLAGLFKTVLALEHGEIPPSLRSTPRNPEIDFDGLRVEVPGQLRAWPEGAPRTAGVSAFGITGTNAHVVLEGVESEERTSAPGIEPPMGIWPIAVSGSTGAARIAAAQRLLEYLEAAPSSSMSDLSWTTTAARDHHRERSIVLAADHESLREALRAIVAGEEHPQVVSGTTGESAPRVAFVFSGQGSQWEGMRHPPGSLAPEFGETLGALGDTVAGKVLAGEAPIEGVDHIQPALGAVQIAMGRQLIAWGLRPEAVAGHSMGEVAAAAVAGVLSAESAIEILEARSGLLTEIAGRGGMALIDEPVAEVEARIEGFGDSLSIAGVNGPRTTVVAGESDSIDRFLEELDSEGVFARQVRVDVASHSAQTDPLLPRLREQLSGLDPVDEQTPLYSTVTGGVQQGTALTGSYWAENLRRPVQLDAAIRGMLTAGVDLFVEVAPHPILSASLADIAHDAGVRPRILCSGKRDETAGPVVLRLLAEAHCLGAPVRWARLGRGDARVLDLPGYPWQRERHWIEGWEQPATPPPPVAPTPVEALSAPDAEVAGAVWAVRWVSLADAPRAHDPLSGRWWVGPADSDDARAFSSLVRNAGGTVVVEPDRSCTGTAWFSTDDRASDHDLVSRATRKTVEVLGAVRRLAEVGCAPRDGSWWITAGVQSPPGRATEEPRAGDAAVWGVATTVLEELPQLDPRLLDCPGSASNPAAALARAVRSGHGDRRFAIEGGRLYGARLQPVNEPPSRRALDPGGAWIVTGGLGALGRVAAEELVRGGVRHLILVGRTPLPPRRRWTSLRPDHPASARVRAVRELESAGASVHLWAVDLGDPGALDDTLDHWEAEGRPGIAGVVHCAGRLHAGLAVDLTEAHVAEMFAGKLGGAQTLRRRLPEARTIYASSLSSTFPRAGQAHYAAANAVLDALARGAPDTLSISWGVWAGTGLVAGEAGARVVREMAEDGLRALSVDEGRRLFDRFRDAGEPHLILAPIDRERLARRHGADGDPFTTDGAAGAPATPPAPRPPSVPVAKPAAPAPRVAAPAPAVPVARTEGRSVDTGAVRGAVITHAARILEMAPDALLLDRPLGSQGLDSVMAMELRNALERELGLRLPASVVWNHPTAEALAAHLAERVGGTVAPDTPSGAEGSGAPSDLGSRVTELSQASDDDILRALRGDGG